MQAALERLKGGGIEDMYERSGLWNEIINAIAYDGDSPESDNMDYVCQNGLQEAIAIECEQASLEDYVLNGMTTVSTMMALSVRNAEKNANIRMIKGLLRVGKEKIPGTIGAYALTAITNLALHPVAHKHLIEAGALQFALGLLHYLDGESDVEMDVGLTSASFICRVVGKEESGPGPDAIKANTKLVEKLLWILTSVLDEGPDGRVIGYHWDPGNILSDVATLATSDRNKPLLVDFVLQLVRAIELRSDNLRAARLAVIALSQLSFEPRCKPKFQEYKERLNVCLDNIIRNFPDSEMEAKRNAQVLLATINESDKPAAEKKKAAGGAFRRAANAVLGTASLTPAQKAAQPQGHVMISYQWDSQPLAIEMEKRFSEAGIKTWFDLNDMGPNINDSMAYAVENALCIVVLFCRKYKESGNCRKECEMGDGLSKPMIFVKVEKDYKQEAWLNLVMGKALWIECLNTGMLDSAFPQIAKRVSAATSQTIKVAAPPAPRASITAAATASVAAKSTSGDSSELLTLLKAMSTQLQEMKTDMTELKAEMKQMRSDVKALKG